MAVVFEGRQLTYQELNSKANQLARHLRKLGFDREVRVGICMERSLEMVIGLLGILKAGRRLYTAGSGLSDGPAGVHSSKFSGGGAIAPTFSASAASPQP